MPKPTPEQLLRRLFPPMLATLAEDAPSDEINWTYELKYDGFRAISAIVDGRIAMWSRNELDLEPRFPHIGEALRKVRGPEMVLDGEVVALDAHGAPRFQLLQQGDQREKLFVFDILWLDGNDLRHLPYVDRREILKKTLRKSPAAIALSQTLDVSGEEARNFAKKNGWEGVIAKKKTSVYEPRRSREWLKLKALNEQEFVIVGWQPSTHSSREIGSLHLAVRGDDGRLTYAGKVGTGFSYKMRVALKDALSKTIIAGTDVKDAPRTRDATWVEPRLVAQVAFTEWTSDNRLRHPSFLGLRDDKGPEEVVREKPVKTNRPRSSVLGPRLKTEKKTKGGGQLRTEDRGPRTETQLTLSNPDRVLYPKDKITKQDLADYYGAVAEPMLRALEDRPLSLEHWNQGIDKPSWYQQGLGREAPKWLTLAETPTRTTAHKTVKHLVADSAEALRWLAQMSVLTIHMWHSRVGHLNNPDWIVFDLDPAKGKGIEQAIEAALVMRKLLDNLELPGFPKTSGKRGIHVFVPIASGYTNEQAHDFACSIAAAVAAKVPWMTVERSLAQRKGRLYLDCEQNAYGKTIVAPYSPRAIDGAPVSAPLKWSEVTKRLDPLKFNLRSMPRRLDKVGDLWEDIFRKRAKLPKFSE